MFAKHQKSEQWCAVSKDIYIDLDVLFTVGHDESTEHLRFVKGFA
jgi:hypothetical protein